jgi:hypothetical protein
MQKQRSKPLSFRRNRLGAVGWATIARALESIKSLKYLNGCSQYAAFRAGGMREIKLRKEWELGTWVVEFLERSASTLTKLDLRFTLRRDPPLTNAPTFASYPNSYPNLAFIFTRYVESSRCAQS